MQNGKFMIMAMYCEQEILQYIIDYSVFSVEHRFIAHNKTLTQWARDFGVQVRSYGKAWNNF